MLSRQEGLTKTYNRFHDPEQVHEPEPIVPPDREHWRSAFAYLSGHLPPGDDPVVLDRLRQLHAVMDYAVAAAYGWDHLDLGHGFHGPSRASASPSPSPPAARSSPASSASITTATPRKSPRASTTRRSRRLGPGSRTRDPRCSSRMGRADPAPGGCDDDPDGPVRSR